MHLEEIKKKRFGGRVRKGGRGLGFGVASIRRGFGPSGLVCSAALVFQFDVFAKLHIYLIIDPEGVVIKTIAFQEIGTPSVRPSVRPGRIGFQDINLYGCTWHFMKGHDPERVLGEKKLKIS